MKSSPPVTQVRTSGGCLKGGLAAILTSAGLTILVLGIGSYYLAPTFWIAEVLSNLALHFSGAALAMTGMLALLGCLRRALLLLLGVVWLGHPIVPYLKNPLQRSPHESDARSRVEESDSDAIQNKIYRLVSYNIRTTNDRYQDIADYLAELNPDFILFIEVDKKWADEMDFELQSHFKHRYALPRPDNLGLAFYSKYSHATGARRIPGLLFPAVEVKLDLPEGTLHLIGHHPISPIRPQWYEQRNRYYTQLADYLTETSINDAFILAGDFNMTPWSPAFKAFVNRTSLIDSALGRGFQSTWYAAPILLAGIPIDHIFISEKIRVVERRIGPNIGSDHRPLILDFRMGRGPRPAEERR